YVLRRIMRRAMRHAHLLGAKDPLMHRMVGSLTGEMGNAFPELIRAKPLIEETLLREETNFRQTLANGLKLLDAEIADMGEGDILPGETAFKLYDTFGFPYDLTEDALRAQSLGVDREGFDKAMAEQKAAARAAWKGSGDQASDAVWFDISEREGSTTGRVVAALLKVAQDQGTDHISSAQITSVMSEDFKMEMKPGSVGKQLKSLHFETSNHRVLGQGRARYIKWDSRLVRKVMRRYVPIEDRKDFDDLFKNGEDEANGVDMEV
ncbi:hypothetical protein LCGC14_3054550, partial [marine sediment metagenome]